VAETSLTVPGIRHVIDTGLARLSRYSYRTKVQRLPIEPISRASADQRAGRCGREAPGVCVRLYGEEDYAGRPEFTDPEILRTNLASVILQMKYLQLGDIDDFPFLEPPDPRYVRDGLKLLDELHALDAANELTELGRRLARLPVDPRIARMLIAGEDERTLTEVLVVAAGLSVQDPRERPMEARAEADEAHAEWRDERSDFLSLLRLWAAWRAQQAALSQRKLRRWCRDHFLSYLRLREWQDVHRQLRQLVKDMGFRENEAAAEYQPLHRALLTGLLSNVALRTGDAEYTGPRNLKLMIFPGSGLAAKRPKWVVAAELVETSRVFARTVAEVRPEWVEPLARHLVSRQHYEPFWQEKAGRVAGFEDVTLYGLPLATRRKINFARVAPDQARAVFIREGLVADRLHSRAPCLSYNRRVIEEVEQLEAKARRRDVLVDAEALYAFYDERLPADVVDGPSFERWIARGDNDASLRMSRSFLMEREAVDVTGDDYPDRLTVDGVTLPLSYHFEPNHPEDGVTAVVPLAALNQLSPEPFEWLVPGLVEEKVAALIRSLPKQLRKNFVPAPDFARAVLDAIPVREGSLEESVRSQLTRMTGVEIPVDAWERVEFPDHLRMHFRVVDADGKTLDTGRDLVALQRSLQGRAASSFSGEAGRGYEREGLRRWDVGELPEYVTFDQGGVSLRGYPALVDEGETVALRLLDSPEKAARAHGAGVRRLLMLTLPDQTGYLRRKLPGIDRLCLLYSSVDRCDALKADIIDAVFDRVFFAEGVPRDPEAFNHVRSKGRSGIVPTASMLVGLLDDILTRHQRLRKRLKGNVSMAQLQSVADVREQLDALIHKGFVQDTPWERLEAMPRFLDAVERRLDRLDRDPGRERSALGVIRRWWEKYLERAEYHRRKGIDDPALHAFRWLLEEYRVSLFAQELGTREKVSEKRLAEAWGSIR